jgi:Na+/H+ antiporter NhaD/arsenite permease-like protein
MFSRPINCWWAALVGGMVGMFAGSLGYDITSSYAAAIGLHTVFALAGMATILLLGRDSFGDQKEAAALGVPPRLSPTG